MAKDPAFLFYSADFYMGTIDMTAAQVGYYIRLMCLQHQQGRLSDALIKSVMPRLDPVVMAKFVQDEDGLWYNERLAKETEKRNDYVSSRRRNARAKTVTTNDDVATPSKHMDKHMHEHMPAQADDHMPEHMENENENRDINTLPGNLRGVAGGKPGTLENRFDALWSLYPKKRGKPAAFAAYKRAIKAGTTDRDIEDGIRAYVTYIDRKRIEEQFIKQGSTFFNGKAWEDDYGERAAQSEPVYTEFTGW